MGIRGLESFIEWHCVEAMEVVDIKKIAQEYKRNTNRDPVIVMDIASCVRPIYAMFGIDWLFGGELKQWEDALKKFVKSFTDIGIKFAVVFDASFPDTKHMTWCLRMKDHFRKVSDIFHHLNRDSSSVRISYEKYFTLPPCVWSVVESVFLSDENCHCWHSVREADEEVAEYAAVHDCFAVLARDTDFIIYNPNQYYLSMKHLNLEKMCTRNYSGETLAKKLKMNISQLPLFATLCGNDTVQFDDVKYFHHDLCPSWRVGRIPFNYLYPVLARYVENKPHGREVLKILREISFEVFRTDEFVPRLRCSLENYWIDPDSYYLYVIPFTGHRKWDEILKKAYERHVKNLTMPQVYNLLVGDAMRHGPSCEDYLSIDILPSSLALMALRKRQYGILFKEKPSKDVYVTEWLTISKNSLESPLFITPWYIDHPGLLKLWDDEDRSMDDVRWKTFCKAVSFKLDHRKVMSVPRDLVLAVLAVFFMQHEVDYRRFSERPPTLETFEIEAFVGQAVLVSTSSSREIAIKSGEFGDLCCYPRAVHLVSLFQRTVCQLLAVSTCCGPILSKKEASAANFFDGKIFHSFYKFCKDGSSGKTLVGSPENEVLYETLMKLVVEV